jgi:hypothetical protein
MVDNGECASGRYGNVPRRGYGQLTGHEGRRCPDDGRWIEVVRQEGREQEPRLRPSSLSFSLSLSLGKPAGSEKPGDGVVEQTVMWGVSKLAT